VPSAASGDEAIQREALADELDDSLANTHPSKHSGGRPDVIRNQWECDSSFQAVLLLTVSAVVDNSVELLLRQPSGQTCGWAVPDNVAIVVLGASRRVDSFKEALIDAGIIGIIATEAALAAVPDDLLLAITSAVCRNLLVGLLDEENGSC
jgi:hypothetical protein